jgi:hypothetical protein
MPKKQATTLAMPIQAEIDREKRRVHAVCSGPVSADDLMRYQTDCWINSCTHGYDGIFDATLGDFTAVDFSTLLDFARIAASIDRHAPPSRLALIALPGKQRRLMDFYLSALELMPGCTNREARIFDELPQALAWVDGATTGDTPGMATPLSND